ncbi:MAG: cupin domain-containing protein [Oscillospiraceae bacterium]
MEFGEEKLREIVSRVLRETAGMPAFEKQVDTTGALLVKTRTIKTEPFEGRSDVRLMDFVTLEEAPRMGGGIMELLDGADFEWTLTYDEFDYVIDGTLEIVLDSGTVLKGGPGDILYIPKNSHIHFRTPTAARYAYFVYPANWQELA